MLHTLLQLLLDGTSLPQQPHSMSNGADVIGLVLGI